MKGLLLLFAIVFGTPLFLFSWFVMTLVAGPWLGLGVVLMIWGGIGYMVVRAVATPPAPVRVTVVPSAAQRVQAVTDAVPDLTPEQRARVAAIVAEHVVRTEGPAVPS